MPFSDLEINRPGVDWKPRPPEANKPDDDLCRYPSGAVRSKLDARYDLVPAIGLQRVAMTMAEGAAKYGEHNWQKGMPIGDTLNHAIAHVYSFLSGDRSEEHLSHAAANLLMAIHTMESENGKGRR
jgi:hypothetical protein